MFVFNLILMVFVFSQKIMGISLIGTLAQIRRFCNVTDLETWVTKKIHKKITKPPNSYQPSIIRYLSDYFNCQEIFTTFQLVRVP